MNDQARIPMPLCDGCQKLELWKTNDREEATYDLGTWEDIMRKAKKRPRCPGCIMLHVVGNYENGHYPSEASLSWRKEGGFWAGFWGETLAFLNQETAKSPNRSARVVQPYIDPALMKKWLKLCETHHKETCAPFSNIIRTSEGDPGVKVLRVIDMEDNCIVDAVPGVRYLALSYAWGGVVPSVRLQQDNLAGLNTKGALLSIREGLPKTISDAIDLVQIMGERYLWVDFLCLVQDDESDMLDGISHMDLVYQCAVLTIIAGHGDGANDGLPGLHPGSREVDQKIVEVLPGIKMTHTCAVYDLLGMTYQQRAWTLQELVLSHRTLMFTEDRIFFRCRANCWGEDTIYDNFPSVTNEVLHSGTGIDFLDDNAPRPLQLCYSELFRYQYRNLTKESDRIHGFTGILRFLSVQMRSGLLEGLFTASFDISLLFWTRGHCLERREGFPSWSWAGWKNVNYGYGKYCGSPEEANSWLQANTYVVWYKRSPETAKLEPVWDLPAQLEHGKPEAHHIGYRPTSEDPYGRTADASLENLRTRPDDLRVSRLAIICEEIIQRKYHFLHFFAHVVYFRKFGKSILDREIREILGRNRQRCRLIQSYDRSSTELPGPHELVLLSKMDVNQVASLSKKRHYDEFLEKAVESKRPIYWVMCIRWLGREKVVAESKAIGFIYQDYIEDLPRRRKFWKEIVLA